MGLLEVLLSLFIAGIIAAGAVLLYGMASDRRNAERTVTEVNFLASVVSQTYRNTTDQEAGDVTDVVANNRLVPKSWLSGSGGINTPYGPVQIAFIGSNAFYIKALSLSRSACQELTKMAYSPAVMFTQPNQVAQYSIRGSNPFLPTADELGRDCTTQGNYVYVMYYLM